MSRVSVGDFTPHSTTTGRVFSLNTGGWFDGLRHSAIGTGTLVCYVAIIAGVGWAADANRLTTEEEKTGFRLVFNGRDLSGWDQEEAVRFTATINGKECQLSGEGPANWQVGRRRNSLP